MIGALTGADWFDSSFCDYLPGRFHLEIELSVKEVFGMFSCSECTFSLLNYEDYDSYETLVSNLATALRGTAFEKSRFLC